jgi:polar amino acid transport system substrate-binding protein
VIGAPRGRKLLGLIACTAVAIGGSVAATVRAHGSTPQPPPPTPTWNKHHEICSETTFRSLPPSALPRPRHMPAGTLMRTIQDRRRLIVGVDESSQGLGYSSRAASPFEGLDIELLQEVARAILGAPRLTFAPSATKQLESAIVNNDVDVVASAFSVTCERRRRMLFSSVYYRGRQRLLVLRNSGIDSLSDPDLHDEEVCAVAGSTSFKRLQREPNVKPFPEDQRSDCLVDLQLGEVAAITADDAILFGFRHQDPTTTIVGPCLGIERYAMAINEDQRPFVRFVNAVLERLRRNGKARRFREHWLKGLAAPAHADVARCDRRASRMPR